MNKTFLCPHHGIEIMIDSDGCPECLDGFQKRQNADTMTATARRVELDRLIYGMMTVKFTYVHQRIEELVGRPVWTHEIGLNPTGLLDEAVTHRHPSMSDVVKLLTDTGKPVIILVKEEMP